MPLVLGCAVLLLFVVPWTLLGLGRMIEKATNRQEGATTAGADAVRTDAGAEQAAWFRQPMRPAFSPRRLGR